MRNVLMGIAAMCVATLLAGCGGGLVGSTYQANEAGGDGVYTLTFVDGEECKFGIGGEVGKLEFTTKYSEAGDTVTIEAPIGSDDPLILTRNGSTLEGEVEGEIVKFVKK